MAGFTLQELQGMGAKPVQPPVPPPTSGFTLQQLQGMGAKPVQPTATPFFNQNATDAVNAGADYTKDLVSSYGNDANEFVQNTQDTANKLNSIQGQGAMGVLKGVGYLGENVLRNASTAIKTVFQPITTGISQFVNYVAGKESDSKTLQGVANSPVVSGALDNVNNVQGHWDQFSKDHPDTARNISDSVNVLGALIGEKPAEQGFGAVKQGATDATKTLADTASSVSNTVGSMADTVNEGLNKVGLGGVPSKITPEMQQQAIQDLSDAYRANSGVKSKKIDMKAGVRGLDSPDLLATHNIVPDIQSGDTISTIDNSAVGYKNAGGAKIQSVIDKYNQAIKTNLEQVADPGSPQIDLEAQRELALKKAASTQGTNATARTALKNSINEEFDSQIAEKGQYVKPSMAQDIKVENYGATKFDAAKPWQNTANGIVGQTMKEAIEQSVGDKFPIKDLNAELGKWYEAQKYYESLNGKKVLGGRLGNYVAKTAGTIVGSKIPIPGASLAGYFIGGKIEDFLADRTFTNPVKQAILKSLKTEDPVAYTTALEAIKNETSARSARLKLPKASYREAPEFKGGTGKPRISAEQLSK